MKLPLNDYISPENNSKIEFNEGVLEILRGFNYITAIPSPGTPGGPFKRSGSYVRYGEITAKIGELQLEIDVIKRDAEKRRQQDEASS